MDSHFNLVPIPSLKKEKGKKKKKKDELNPLSFFLQIENIILL